MNNAWNKHIIDVADLATDAANTLIFDCRFDLMNPEAGKKLYTQNHLPGAFYLDLNQDLSSPVGTHGGRHPFPEIERFVARLRECGVNQDTQIVAYDDNKCAFAARLWYLCHHIGHPRVKILNGGFSAWCRAGLPVTSSIPSSSTGNLTAKLENQAILTYAQVRTLSEQLPANTYLIDSREEPRYLGLQEPIDPIAGHIPHAENLPWTTAVDTEGLLLDPKRQAQRWEKFSPETSELVVYCGSGVTACVNLLSLAVQGITHAKLYAGSWSDWCTYQKLCQINTH